MVRVRGLGGRRAPWGAALVGVVLLGCEVQQQVIDPMGPADEAGGAGVIDIGPGGYGSYDGYAVTGTGAAGAWFATGGQPGSAPLGGGLSDADGGLAYPGRCALGALSPSASAVLSGEDPPLHWALERGCVQFMIDPTFPQLWPLFESLSEQFLADGCSQLCVSFSFGLDPAGRGFQEQWIHVRPSADPPAAWSEPSTLTINVEATGVIRSVYIDVFDIDAFVAGPIHPERVFARLLGLRDFDGGFDMNYHSAVCELYGPDSPCQLRPLISE